METTYNLDTIERLKQESLDALKRNKGMKSATLMVSQAQYVEYQKYQKEGNRIRVRFKGIEIPVRVKPVRI